MTRRSAVLMDNPLRRLTTSDSKAFGRGAAGFIVAAAVLVCFEANLLDAAQKEIFDLFCVQPGNPSPSLIGSTVSHLLAGLIGA